MDVLGRDRETGTGDKGWRESGGRFRGERKEGGQGAGLERKEI